MGYMMYLLDRLSIVAIHSGDAVLRQVNTVGIYLLKVNNRNTRTRCEICSKLTIRTPERR